MSTFPTVILSTVWFRSLPVFPVRASALRAIGCALIVTGVLLSSGFGAPRPDRNLIPNPVVTLEPTTANFPYVVPVFAKMVPGRPGDKVTLMIVRGDRPVLEPGGTYCFLGTYELNSAPTAELGLSLTRVAPEDLGQGMEINPTHGYRLERGSGTFSFLAKMGAIGYYHVSWHMPDKEKKKSVLAGGVNIYPK